MPGPQPPLDRGDYIEVDEQVGVYQATKSLIAKKWPPCRAADTEEDERVVAKWLRDKIDPRLITPDATELDDLVSSIQEDLVIMRKEENAAPDSATADYLNVSFPSGWCPTCALRQTFVNIHHRVPEDGNFTGKNRPGRAAFLFKKEPTVRFAWSLTPDKSLDRRKCHADPNHGTAPPLSWNTESPTVYLRIERQVVAPIDRRLSVFLIRVYIYDVAALEPEERARLRDNIVSMTTAVATYKSLIDERGIDHRKQVIALLA
jgi:hypothetical protein